MAGSEPVPWFYRGNAIVDDVGGSRWFVGQFIPPELGLRHQDAVELKWGIHRRGESRPAGPAANGVATTISVLIKGVFRTMFSHGSWQTSITLKREGDYLIFGPDVIHSWEALEDAVVLSIRFPSVETSQAPAPLRQVT